MRLAAESSDADAAASPPENYDELTVDETLKKDAGQVNQILMAGNFGPGDQPLFDDFYQQYFLARWTQVKNIVANPSKKVPGLPIWRKELRNSHLGKRSGAAAVHDHLNTLVLDFMKKLAAGNYHPAVRVNAMLAIGELNTVEPPPKAVPLPEALTVLLDAVKSSNLSDAIRAAAMVGILRHAEAGIGDDDVRRSLTAAMLRVTAEDPPTGPAAPGREWILAQAVETLALLKSPGEDAAVYNALLKTAGESKLRLCTRCVAAESLGKLDYSGATGIDPMPAAATLAQFAIDACAYELGQTTDAGSEALRRQLKQRLDAVLAALKAIATLAHEPQQPALAELQKSLKDLSELLDDKGHKDENMKPRIEDLRKKIDAWLQKKPA
jgi:hypothetical protein